MEGGVRKVKKETPHIDLETGIYLQIEVESKVPNTFLAEPLAAIAKSMQALVFAIAGYEHQDFETVRKYFEIELCGYSGEDRALHFRYAVKQYKHSGLGLKSVKRLVDRKMSLLFQMVAGESFADLHKIYPTELRRDEIVGRLNKFLSAPGTTSLRIVKKDEHGAIEPIYFLRKLEGPVFTELLVRDPATAESFDDGKQQIAYISFPDGNYERPQIGQLFSSELHSIDYSPTTIVAPTAVYQLKYPLRCKVATDHEGTFIESEILDVIGFGGNIHEAEQDFGENFDYAYTRYNQLDDSKLTARLKLIKHILNEIVTLVEEKDG